MKPETLMAFGVSQEHAEKVAAEIAQAIAANEAEDPKLTDEAIDAPRGWRVEFNANRERLVLETLPETAVTDGGPSW